MRKVCFWILEKSIDVQVFEEKRKNTQRINIVYIKKNVNVDCNLFKDKFKIITESQLSGETKGYYICIAHFVILIIRIYLVHFRRLQ